MSAATEDRGDTFTPTGDDVATTGAAAPIIDLDKQEVEQVVGATGAAEDAKGEEGKKTDERPRDEDGKFIPKSRFDAAVTKERSEKEALAAQVAQYQERDARAAASQDVQAAQKAMKEMIVQHTNFIADGQLEKAADLMESILDYRAAISERIADQRAIQTKDAAKEEIRYDQTVATVEAQHPELNPDHADYDPVVVRKVTAYMTGLMQTERKTAAIALREAVDQIIPPKAAAADPATAKKAEEAGLRRKEEGVKKALDAKNKQPAATGNTGLDHDKLGGGLDAAAVAKMSWEEFIKLPEAELSKMRGDFIN